MLRSKRNISKYIMQGHHASVMNNNRWDLLMSSTFRIDTDGLTNIEQKSRVVAVEKYYKYTRVMVDVELKK